MNYLRKLLLFLSKIKAFKSLRISRALEYFLSSALSASLSSIRLSITTTRRLISQAGYSLCFTLSIPKNRALETRIRIVRLAI